MSDLVVMTKDDLKKFALDILAEHDKKHRVEPKPKEWISESETCEILGIKPATLAKLRHERKVQFNRASRPFTYNQESVIFYRDSKATLAYRV